MKKLILLSLIFSSAAFAMTATERFQIEQQQKFAKQSAENLQKVTDMVNLLDKTRERLVSSKRSYTPNSVNAEEAKRRVNLEGLRIAENKVRSAESIEKYLGISTIKMRDMKQEGLNKLYQQKLTGNVTGLLAQAAVVEAQYPPAKKSEFENANEAMLYGIVQRMREVDSEGHGKRTRRRMQRHLNWMKEQEMAKMDQSRAQHIINKANSDPIHYPPKPITEEDLVKKYPEHTEMIREQLRDK